MERPNAHSGGFVCEWHFNKHAHGWAWRCTTKHGTVESVDCFQDILDAIANAADHGYVSGSSRIGSMGPVPNKWAQLDAAVRGARSGDRAHTKLIVRRNLEVRWIWELRAVDGHLLDRSDADFATRADCEADASRKGLTP